MNSRRERALVVRLIVANVFFGLVLGAAFAAIALRAVQKGPAALIVASFVCIFGARAMKSTALSRWADAAVLSNPIPVQTTVAFAIPAILSFGLFLGAWWYRMPIADLLLFVEPRSP